MHSRHIGIPRKLAIWQRKKGIDGADSMNKAEVVKLNTFISILCAQMIILMHSIYSKVHAIAILVRWAKLHANQMLCSRFNETIHRYRLSHARFLQIHSYAIVQNAKSNIENQQPQQRIVNMSKHRERETEKSTSTHIIQIARLKAQQNHV